MKKYLFLFIHLFCLCLKVEAGILEANYYPEDAQRLIQGYASRLSNNRENRKALRRYIKKRCELLEKMQQYNMAGYVSILEDRHDYKISGSGDLMVLSYKESIDLRVTGSFLTLLEDRYKNIPRSELAENYNYYLHETFKQPDVLSREQCEEELEYHHAFLARLNEEYPRTCVLI